MACRVELLRQPLRARRSGGAEVLGDTTQWLLDRVGAVVHVEGVLICDWVRAARAAGRLLLSCFRAHARVQSKSAFPLSAITSHVK